MTSFIKKSLLINYWKTEGGLNMKEKQLNFRKISSILISTEPYFFCLMTITHVKQRCAITFIKYVTNAVSIKSRFRYKIY